MKFLVAEIKKMVVHACQEKFKHDWSMLTGLIMIQKLQKIQLFDSIKSN